MAFGWIVIVRSKDTCDNIQKENGASFRWQCAPSPLIEKIQVLVFAMSGSEGIVTRARKSDDLLHPGYHAVALFIDHDVELYVDHDEYIGMVLFIYHGEDICTVVLLRRNIRLPGPVAVIEKVPVARSG